ncbi:nicotinamide riboside kinase [Rhodococcus fascians]|uniref:AAA family ATPase n=1 Tax=Nocardiaceae TaxID=85025 RepID=UPI0028597E16|nr:MULTISPECIES: AAA family ATPase [Rhodococcus]MDR6910110.1 nicotinamide riboside kinase [Rhodococcus sp. 3258]MDR6931244.1 nicotinamide riboside kinase [Rhodococcus fascians]
MKLAVVGSYGNGKTTLSTAIAEELNLSRVHATPMVLSDGALQISLEQCDELELLQLVSRRLIERVSAESAALDTGFVSDGSVLHELLYAAIRYRFGLHPSDGECVPTRILPAEAKAVEALRVEVVNYARQTYDAVIFVPNEKRLSDDPPPISEQFRALLDSAMLDLLKAERFPYVVVRGPVRERTDAATGFIASL